MKTSEIAALITDTAKLYVNEPASIEINTQENTNGAAYFPAAYFVLRGAKSDEARLVGRKGTHVNALKLLILQVGKAQCREFTFRLISDPQNVTPWVASRDAFSYDPEPARNVLRRWLRALDVAIFEVRAENASGPAPTFSYDFVIKCSEADDMHDLLRPLNPQDAESSVLASLGTLFRAMARQAGVRFQIRVEC